MNQDELIAYCLDKPRAWIEEPADGDVAAKIGDEMFAIFGMPEGNTIGLKCGADADEAHGWRERYPDDITVMPYLGRYGWNTFKIGGEVTDAELRVAVDASYADVLARASADPDPGTA